MLAPKFSLGGVDMPWRRKSSPAIIGPSPSKGSCSSRTIEQYTLSRAIVAVGNCDCANGTMDTILCFQNSRYVLSG
jgi:hypothetical protein